jgi:hypothetical protein
MMKDVPTHVFDEFLDVGRPEANGLPESHGRDDGPLATRMIVHPCCRDMEHFRNFVGG